MWEERSCRQTREWQHWGSGCYRYKCERGRLHIIIANYSYECFYAGQELSVQLMAGGWLHKGAVVCPSCKEVCNYEFEQRGDRCKTSEEAPPSSYYPKNELKCGASSIVRPTHEFNVLISLLAIGVSVVMRLGR